MRKFDLTNYLFNYTYTYSIFSVWTFLLCIFYPQYEVDTDTERLFQHSPSNQSQTRRFLLILYWDGSSYFQSFLANLSHRKYFWTAIKRNFSINSSESKTAIWAARPKKNPLNLFITKMRLYFQPIRELVLLGRAWWIS